MGVKIISHERYGKCRVAEDGWYVAADVGRILGYIKGTDFAHKHVEEEDKRHDMVRSLRSTHCARTLLINKRGLNNMIEASGNVEGEAIKAWLLNAAIEENALVAQNLPQVFTHPQFGNLRAISLDGEAWFIGKDVATSLGYSNTKQAIIDHVPDKFKKEGVAIRDPLGGINSPVLINEAGLYKLVMRSKMPKAEEFSDWACGEVLPSINKYGYYSVKPVAGIKEAERLKKQLATLRKFEFAVVYLLLLSNGAVKIGYTSDLTERVRQIKSETGLEVLNYKTTAYLPLDEAKKLEAALKEKYAADCIEGEYYDVRFTDICEEI